MGEHKIDRARKRAFVATPYRPYWRRVRCERCGKPVGLKGDSPVERVAREGVVTYRHRGCRR